MGEHAQVIADVRDDHSDIEPVADSIDCGQRHGLALQPEAHLHVDGVQEKRRGDVRDALRKQAVT